MEQTGREAKFTLSEMICFLKKLFGFFFFCLLFFLLIVNRFLSVYIRIFIQRSDLKDFIPLSVH